MSKAFTQEEAPDAPVVVPPRAPLPDGVPNYVTERGLARLREELEALATERPEAAGDPEAARALLAARRSLLEERIASAQLVPLPAEPGDAVRFGATVHVRGADGVRRYRIVGVDEADAAEGRIAFVSPLARALLGKAAGDRVRLRAPRGDEELEIEAVEYRGEP